MLRPRVIALLLGLITLLAYLPGLQNGFQDFDDLTYVSQNTHIQQGVTPKMVEWAFTSFYASNWHPLTWITHAVDYTLFRQNPAGHHFVSALFHSANAALLFLLLLYLTERKWPSAFVAALFAWHPLHVESVAWVAELKDVSCVFWGLLAMLAYARYARGREALTEKAESGKRKAEITRSRLASAAETIEGGQKSDGGIVGRVTPCAPGVDISKGGAHGETRPALGFYWLALGLFALSLMSKAMLVTLPFVLLLLDFWPLQRLQKFGRRLIEKLPFLLLAAGASYLTVLAQKGSAMASLAAVPFQLRLENVVTAYAGYLGKMVWPAHLTILYPLPDQISPGTLGGCALVLAAISALVVWGWRRQPWLPVGWLWYLGTLVPVIGLVQVGSQAMADRYTYFPSIGIFVAVAWSAAALARRFHVSKLALTGLAVLILAGCLARTERQLPYWRDTQTLFTQALQNTTNNPLAHLVLGDAYQAANEPEKAMAEYQTALTLSKEFPNIYQSIGRLLGVEGKTEEAVKYYQMALKYSPRSAVLHDSLGALYIQLKQYDEAETEFTRAIELNPDYAPARFRMAWTLLRKGQGMEAKKQFLEAARLDPDNAATLLYTARVLASSENAQVRDGAAACRLASAAGRLAGGDSVGALDTLAAGYAECGQFGQAVATQQQALSLAAQVGATNSVPAMKESLELYRQNKPLRKSFDTP